MNTSEQFAVNDPGFSSQSSKVTTSGLYTLGGGTKKDSATTTWLDENAPKSNQLTLSPCCLSVDVIAIFQITTEELLRGGRSQERFEVKVPVTAADVDPMELLNRELFPRIRKTLKKFGWNTDRLIEISTFSNWSLYDRLTGKPSLVKRGHPCKWFFGENRDDLDPWEKYLIERHKFGTALDMGWIRAPEHASSDELCFQSLR